MQQSRKPSHSLKILILLRRSVRLKPDNFSKSKPEPGPNPTSPIIDSSDCYYMLLVNFDEITVRGRWQHLVITASLNINLTISIKICFQFSKLFAANIRRLLDNLEVEKTSSQDVVLAVFLVCVGEC